MRGHPDSDVDPQAEERLDAEQGRNLVWCEPCRTAHLPEAHETAGPFPQEPAPGSPEAVAEAARIIAALLFVNGMGQEADRLAMMAKDGCRERHLGGWCRKAVERQVQAGIADLVAQRDALADALESCDWSYGRVQSDEVHEKIKAALRLAGRLP